MPIIFDCPQCGREIRVRSEAAGQTGRCTTCESRITVPDASDFTRLAKRSPNSGCAFGSTSDLPTGFLKELTESESELWITEPTPPTTKER